MITLNLLSCSILILYHKSLIYLTLFTIYLNTFINILGSALSLAGDPNGGGNAISRTTKQVMTALKKTGDAYNEMGGRLIDELPAAGWDSFADMLHVYRGIAASFPDILAVHKVSIKCYYH